MQIPKDELWIYEGIFFVILFTLLFALLAAQTRRNEPPHPVPFGRVDASPRFASGDATGVALWAGGSRLPFSPEQRSAAGAPPALHADRQPEPSARSVRRND